MVFRDPFLSALAGFLFAAGMLAPVRGSGYLVVNGLMVADLFVTVLAVGLYLRNPAIYELRSRAHTDEIRTRPRRNPFKSWISGWLFFVILYLFASTMWAEDAFATGNMALRVSSGLVIFLYLRRHGDPRWIAAGALFVMVNHAALLLGGFTQDRQPGITASITVLAMVSVWPALVSGLRLPGLLRLATGLTAALTLAAAGSRAPCAVVSAMQLRRGKLGVVLAAVTVGLFLFGTIARGQLDRVASSETITADIHKRAATVKLEGEPSLWQQMTGKTWLDEWMQSRAYGAELGGAELTWLGYGIDGYEAAAGWPRPHNAFSLLIFEMGVFIVLPISAGAWLMWQRRREPWSWYTAAVMFAWLLLDESMVSAEGFYGLLLLLAVWSGGPSVALTSASRSRRERVRRPFSILPGRPGRSTKSNNLPG